jgi:predicted ABC-type sugar transport system permease subunit
MTPGIEVFGRGATIVEVAPEQVAPRRTALLGFGALAMAIVTAVLTGLGVGASAAGDESAAQWLAIAAIAASILSVLIGLAALVTGRGRVSGALAAAIAVLANPWVLLHVLDFFSTNVG